MEGLINNINIQVSGNNNEFTPKTYSTKILKPNIINENNILVQNMINDENTKYIIKWDYDLHAQTITIPNNSILEFDGGSFSNGKLIGHNTYIITYQDSQEVLKNITTEGIFIYKNPNFRIMSESEYESLDNYDKNTIYFVTED